MRLFLFGFLILGPLTTYAARLYVSHTPDHTPADCPCDACNGHILTPSR